MRVLCLIVVASLLTAACNAADASGPPEINYGRDLCIECGMIISEAKFATAYRAADGAERIFDDVGDMIVYLEKTGEHAAPESIWVHDFETEEWVAASDAHFVPTLSVASPMGHSIVAFSDMGRATAFAQSVDGEVIPWTTVAALPIVEGLVGEHHHEEGVMSQGHTDDMDHDEMEHEEMEHGGTDG